MSKRRVVTPPHHVNPSTPNRTAVAPYDFVPIPDRIIVFPVDKNPLLVDHDKYHHGQRLSGWIDVDLETKSPVYVRGPQSSEEFAKAQAEENPNNKTPDLEKVRNKPEFFHTGDPDDPVIPGSSLRGLLRSMVEVLGHGKLTPVSDDPLIYRAVGDTTSHGDAYRDQMFESDPQEKHHYAPRFKGGYIRRRGQEWAIQPAKSVNGTTFARVAEKRTPKNLKRWEKCRNASEIFVEISPYGYKEVRGGFIHIKRASVTRAEARGGSGLQRAALARSGRMFSKRTEAVIFEPDNSAPRDQWIRIPNGSREGERDLVTYYRDQMSPAQQRLLGNNGVLVNWHPVFYLMDGDDLVFFGHPQMFRIPYPHTPQELLPRRHTDDKWVDMAESMFGRVPKEGEAIAGRVFVSDAHLQPDQDDPWLPGKAVVIPKILASPKPTTFQHYLVQTQPDEKRQLSSYSTPYPKTTLRGHKLYWHKGDAKVADFTVDEAEIRQEAKRKEKDIKQYTRMKPVRSGVKFSFRVRFENLGLPELGLLWWAISLPVEGDYCHKIGMAKPLGLGAIKLKARLQTISRVKRYQKLFAGGTFEEGLESPDQVTNYQEAALKVFEDYMEKMLGGRLAQTPRVQMLLAMLSWPGPDPQKTRYMEIERPDPNAKRGKRNEYRDRPVLPDPLGVTE